MNYLNPMLNQLNNQANASSLNNRLNQIKGMMNMVRGAKNPNLMLQQLMMNNPNMKNVMDYVNQNGGDPKQAFYKMAQEKGVNPNQILNMLQL